jgi:hypothetical protein
LSSLSSSSSSLSSPPPPPPPQSVQDMVSLLVSKLSGCT